MADNDPRVVRQRAKIEKLAKEAKRLETLAVERTTAWQAAGGALNTATRWLSDARGNLEAYEGAEPKLLKNESLLDGIERLCRRIDELKADSRRIKNAPVRRLSNNGYEQKYRRWRSAALSALT